MLILSFILGLIGLIIFYKIIKREAENEFQEEFNLKAAHKALERINRIRAKEKLTKRG